MKADLEAVQKRREFLSRTGIVVLGALPAGAGLTPRTALAGGCAAEMMEAGRRIALQSGFGVWGTTAGVLLAYFGPTPLKAGGVVLAVVGVNTAVKDNIGTLIKDEWDDLIKACSKSEFKELNERIE